MSNPHTAMPLRHCGLKPADAAKVAIVLHGRNQDPEWIIENLIDRLTVEGVSYLVPHAADNSWYPQGFIADRSSNEPGLSGALAIIDDLVTNSIAEGKQTYVVGFSQGACLVADYAAANPGRLCGAAVITGGLIGPADATWDLPDLEGLPVLLSNGDDDPWVPLSRSLETRSAFEAAGADVDWQVYPGLDHVICDDQIERVSRLLAS